MKNVIILVKTILLLIFSAQTTIAQEEKYTINGYVRDATNGETLIGANIFAPRIESGTISNEYGFYSISLPAGDHQIIYSYLGFETQVLNVTLNQNLKQDIDLGFESNELAEIVVSSKAKNSNVSDLEMSVNSLDIKTIQRLPTLLGEVEVLRSIQLLPGVSTVGEGAAGFNVRGGSIDQNLVLLDEAPVYNSSHLFGFFSVFNPDAVKDVKLYKGGIPSRYGGRLSSILDVRMKEGNSKRLSLNGGVGAIFSRLSVEAPIIKDKASFIVAGRRSYIDVLAKPFLDEGLDDSVLNFYDLTVKTNYNINEKNRIFLSGYTGRDNFGFGDQAGFNWGNRTLTFRWNHLFSEKLFSNITLFASDYDYDISFGDDSVNRFDWNASILNYSIKPEMSYYLNTDNLIRFGGQGIIYKFEPGMAVGISEGETRDLSQDPKYAIESALFVENEMKISDALQMNVGLRFSHFNYTGQGEAVTFGESEDGLRRPVIGIESFGQWETIQTYSNLEPRASLKYQMNETSSIKASYMRTAQYIHLISNTAASTPVDIWTPSTHNLKPQVADQVALGYFKNFKDDTYEFSAEVYYKDFDRLVEYIDGADILLNDFLEGDLLEGEGRAYGIEVMLKKNGGKFSGWLSYTLARTERLVPGINNNEWYPSRFDQTHNLSLTGFYELSKRISFSSNFALISGTPVTFATSRFEQQGFIIPHNLEDSRNNVRIPTFHRLDVSATLKGKDKPGKRWKGEWVFSIYNVYSRRNAFSIFFRQDVGQNDPGVPINTEAIRLSVIGNFIPAISYNFKF